MRRIRQASVPELTEVPGVGPSTARAVLAALGSDEKIGPEQKAQENIGAEANNGAAS
ncbi:MAG: hypothetical protein WAN20_12765 [Pseudonocardiaceae bacterium]